MKINGPKIYENDYFKEIQQNETNNNITKIKDNESHNQPQQSINNHDKILSQTEREFFIKMFPASSEQIKNHTLFTNKGKLKTAAINKGMIVDGKA